MVLDNDLRVALQILTLIFLIVALIYYKALTKSKAPEEYADLFLYIKTIIDINPEIKSFDQLIGKIDEGSVKIFSVADVVRTPTYA